MSENETQALEDVIIPNACMQRNDLSSSVGAEMASSNTVCYDEPMDEQVQHAVTFAESHVSDRNCDGSMGRLPKQTNTQDVSMESEGVETKVEEAMQLQGELLQDVTSRAQLMQGGEDEMIDWMESDPLLEVNKVLGQSGLEIDPKSFFALAKSLNAEQVQQRRELLLKGIEIVRRLQDPEWQGTFKGAIPKPQVSRGV